MGTLGAGARTPAEAVTAFFDLHQRAVACVTPAVLTGQAYRPAAAPFTMLFGEGWARLGRGHLSLRVRVGYRFVPPPGAAGRWRVETASYAYRVRDRAERLLVDYHWHPTGSSPVTFPHLHVGCRIAPFDFERAHLPTGFVSLPAVIRLAIADLGVAPLHPDWAAVLDLAERELAE